MQDRLTLIALCAVGAEKVLVNELDKLDLSYKDKKEKKFGKVRFSASLKDVYRCLMGLRTADRALLEAASFPSDNFDALFEGVYSVHWEDYIPRNIGVCVSKVRARASKLQAETSVQAVVHKAIAKRLCEKWKIRRLTETVSPAEIRVYLEKDSASILLDLSGDPLFKRGYRTQGGVAPLRETTASAILHLAGWRRKFPLYDPFCGSGTIVIEAALYAWDAAPGLGRRFAVENLAFHNPSLLEETRRELREKVDFTRVIRIYGSDSDPASISNAKKNLERAYEIALGEKKGGVIEGKKPELSVLDMKDAVAPENDAGFIITNPPYGKRLGEKSVSEALYRDIAVLAERFPRWNLGVITDNAGFESFFGKKADSCREIANGAIPSYFFHYVPTELSDE